MTGLLYEYSATDYGEEYHHRVLEVNLLWEREIDLEWMSRLKKRMDRKVVNIMTYLDKYPVVLGERIPVYFYYTVKYRNKVVPWSSIYNYVSRSRYLFPTRELSFGPRDNTIMNSYREIGKWEDDHCKDVSLYDLLGTNFNIENSILTLSGTIEHWERAGYHRNNEFGRRAILALYYILGYRQTHNPYN